MRCIIVIILMFLVSSSAFSQDATQRERAAIPFLMQEISNRIAQWAVCSGDLQGAQQQLAAIQAQLAEARKQIEDGKKQ